MADATRAARSYIAGDVILDYMEPLIKCLHQTTRDQHCSNCFLESNYLFDCSSCMHFRYCSKVCKAVDWHKGHSVECKFLKSKTFRDYCLKNPMHDYFLLMLRLYAMLKIDPAMGDRKVSIINGVPLSFNELPLDAVCELNNRIILHQSSLLLQQFIAVDPMCGIVVDHLIRWFLIIVANAFSVWNDSGSMQIGAGIFVGPGFLKHSCKPTALVITNGRKLQVRAIAEIAAGTMPRITYFLGNYSRTERQNMLMAHYALQCHCEMCEGRADADTDYDRLNMLMRDLHNYQFGSEDTFLLLHSEIMQVLRQLYHEFDQRITNQIQLALRIAMAWNMSTMLLGHLFMETFDHILTTFGHDHPMFFKFMWSSASLFSGGSPVYFTL